MMLPEGNYTSVTFGFVREQSEGATENTYPRLCANPKCTLPEVGHILKWQLSWCVTVMPQQIFLPHVMVRLQSFRRTEHVVFTYISGEDVQVLRLVGGGLLAPENSPKNSCPILWIPDWPLWLGIGHTDIERPAGHEKQPVRFYSVVKRDKTIEHRGLSLSKIFLISSLRLSAAV